MHHIGFSHRLAGPLWFFVSSLCLLASPVIASQRLEFIIFDSSGGGNCDDCGDHLLIQGTFDADAPARFASFVKRHKFRSITFNSAEGDHAAGLEIGRQIRAGRWSTYLASEVIDWAGLRTGAQSGKEILIARKAVCLSACAYAFLGGEKRRVENGAFFGVHQFQSTSIRSSERMLQNTAALLASYLDEMGVDRKVLDASSSTAVDQMLIVPQSQMASLRVTSQIKAAAWSIQTRDSGKPFLQIDQLQEHGHVVRAVIYEKNGEMFLYFGTFLDSVKYSTRHKQMLGTAEPLELTVNGIRFNWDQPAVFRMQRVKDKLVVFTEVRIPPRLLVMLQKAKSFDVENFTGRANSDMSPAGTFGVDGLSKGLVLLAENQTPSTH